MHVPIETARRPNGKADDAGTQRLARITVTRYPLAAKGI